jgi:cytidylate kinase
VAGRGGDDEGPRLTIFAKEVRMETRADRPQDADLPGFTITISRQLGSGGCEVATAVAEQLGYRLVWRELINQAALRCGSPEAALAAIDELGLMEIDLSPQAMNTYRQAVRAVMEELAERGRVVIVGRAGQVILAHKPNLLHVRLIASSETRAARLAAKHSISLSGARAQIAASDAYRQKYLKRFYQVQWDNPYLYDLILNTDRLTEDEAAALICAALSRRQSALLASPPCP